MARRIVSLSPAASEILCAVGARGDLVGISHEHDSPKEVLGLPAVTRGGNDPLDSMLLLSLAPDLIVTQEASGVGAISYDDVCSAVARTVGRNVTILNLHATRLEEIFDDVERVGRAIGREDAAERLIERLRARIASVRARVAEGGRRHPRALVIESLEPMTLAGAWTSELVALAGAESLGPAPGAAAMALPKAELARLRPDVLVLLSRAGLGAELPELSRALPLEGWPCKREGRIFVLDGNLTRPGPRIVDALEILAGILHPELFPDELERFPRAVRRVRS